MAPAFEDSRAAIETGQAAAQRGEHDVAEAAYRAALELAEDEDDMAHALHALAHQLINTGRGAESGPLWLKLAGLKEAPPVLLCEAHVAVGYEHQAHRRYEEALESYAACKAVAGGLAQTRASAFFHSAQIYFEENKYAEARTEIDGFERIKDSFPDERKKVPKLRKQIEQRMAK